MSSRKYKFINNIPRPEMADPEKAMTGLFSWIPCLGAEVGGIKNSPKTDPDVVYYFIHDAIWHITPVVRKEYPTSHILVMLDEAPNVWPDDHQLRNNPDIIYSLAAADTIIAPHPLLADYFSSILQREVHYCTYPEAQEKKFEISRQKAIAIIHHRYNPNYLTSKYLADFLRTKTGFHVVHLGVDPSQAGRVAGMNPVDQVVPIVQPDNYQALLGQVEIIIDLQEYPSIGRTGIEAAQQRTPYISQNNGPDSGRILFPDLQVSSLLDMNSILEKIKYIIENKSSIINKSNKQLKHYSWKNRRTELEQLIFND